MIIGRDIMHKLGNDLKFSTGSMTWDNVDVSVQELEWLDTVNVDDFEEELFMMHDPETTDAERIQSVLDVKCKQKG